MIEFVLLDSRNGIEAKIHNDAVLGSGPVLGIEISIPELAARCSLGNIDHITDPITGKSYAACDQAMRWSLPTDWPGKTAIIAILKPDSDTICTAAILNGRVQMRKGGPPRSLIKEARIQLISRLDRFAKNPVWHPSALPTRDNPWPGEFSIEYSALAAMCADNSVALEKRVQRMLNWLKDESLDINDPLSWMHFYSKKVDQEREELISALEDGQIKYELIVTEDFGFPRVICVITSTYRSATMIGYCMAPVVIAENPEFRFGDLPPVRKISVCAWSDRYADIPAVCRELAALEPGWGGHGNICGSPQGMSSKIETQTVVEVVQRHLSWRQNETT